MNEYERICPFCKQAGEHSLENPCDAMKKSGQVMAMRAKEMRRHYMEDEQEWPPRKNTVKEWKAHGLDCAVAKGHTALCGYVRVPSGHPDENHHYDDVEDVSVHGGITFTCRAMGGGRWFGFDTAHFDDWWGYYDKEKNYGTEHPGKIWTIEDVVQETEKFAEQLAAKGGQK